ncbi:hypothetical protein OK016_11350 [Vibrio chagasii]|nr:hypothetical protein [Vibrio chagasii]
MSDFGSGSIKFEYLPDDKKFKDSVTAVKRSARAYRDFSQESWLFEVDYPKSVTLITLPTLAQVVLQP